MTTKQIKIRFSNVYKAAYHLERCTRMYSNDLLAPDWSRQYNKGASDAYAAIRQMIEDDRLGSVDYWEGHNYKDKELPIYLK